MSTQRSDENVAKLYKQFQREREQRSLMSRHEVLRAIDSQTQTGNEEQHEADEEHVITLYRRYKASRDPNRDEVISQVLSYARKKVVPTQSEVKHDMVPGLLTRWLMAPSRVLAGLKPLLSNQRERFARTQWALALPVVAIAIAVYLLMPGVKHEGLPEYLATIRPTFELPTGAKISDVDNLVARSPTFGFSHEQSENSILFELGQLLAGMDFSYRLEDQLKSEAAKSGIAGLLERLALPKESRPDFGAAFPEYSSKLLNWLSDQPLQTDFVTLGYWTESALVLTQIDSSQYGVEHAAWLQRTTGMMAARSMPLLGGGESPEGRLLQKILTLTQQDSIDAREQAAIRHQLRDFEATLRSN